MPFVIKTFLVNYLNGQRKRLVIEDVINDIDSIFDILKSPNSNNYRPCSFEFHKDGAVIDLGHFDENSYLSSWIMHVLRLEEKEEHYDADQGWELIAKRIGDSILITQNDDPAGNFVAKISVERNELVLEWERISHLYSRLRKILNIKSGCYSWIL